MDYLLNVADEPTKALIKRVLNLIINGLPSKHETENGGEVMNKKF